MKSFYLLLLTNVIMMNIHAQTVKNHLFTWSEAKQLPDPEGFAGPYAGVSGGALIVAGGSNFPGGKRPWGAGGIEAGWRTLVDEDAGDHV